MKRRLFSFSVLGMLAISSFGFLANVKENNVVEVSAKYTPSKTYTNHDGDTYYASISDSLTGDSLRSALYSLNNSKRKTKVGYGTMGTSIGSSAYIYTDYDPKNYQTDDNGQKYGSTVLSFYSGNPAVSWNREHMWPNSHGGSLVEGDIHHTRPTIPSENGSRGNSFYVEGKKDGTYGWDPAMESFGEETYRGDSARVIFYSAIAESKFTLVDLEYHKTSKDNPDYMMGKLSDLLKWNLQYPVLEREQNRNEGAEYLQGNRNPFIDHPEYACKIWGNTNSSTQSICSQYSGKSVTIKTSDGKTGDQNIIVGESLSFDGYVDSVKEASVSWSLVTSSDAAYEGDALSISVSSGVATVTAAKLGEAYLKASYTYDKDGTSKTVTAKIKLTAKNPAVLDSIAVKDPKTEYAVGESFVKPKVIATYTDSSTVDVTSSASFSGFDSTTAGEKTITVTYLTEETSYTINVIEAPTKTLTYISVTAPDKLDYYVGESLDKGGMKVFAKFSDGTNVNITKEATLSFEGPFTEAGTKTIVVSYTFNGTTKEDTFDVTVKEKPIDPPSGGGSGNGCGGNVATTSVILASFALAGIITIVISSVIRKKKNKA